MTKPALYIVGAIIAAALIAWALWSFDPVDCGPTPFQP